MQILKRKIQPPHFQDILEGRKRFEIRREDIPEDPVYLVGVFLCLQEWVRPEDRSTCGMPVTPDGYTLREVTVQILLRTTFGQAYGWCVLGISDPLVGINEIEQQRRREP